MDNPRYWMHQGGDKVRIHYHSPIAGILLPGGQAIATGFFVAIPIGILAKSWYWFWLAWAVTQGITWLLLMRHWRKLTSQAEQFLGLDINGDGYIGQPEAIQETVRVAIKSEDGSQTTFLDMPVDRERLGLLAAGVMAGVPLAESSWVGPGKFTRYEFVTIRDELIKRGYAAWISPAAKARGVRLTSKGKATMRGLVALPSPTDEHLST